MILITGGAYQGKSALALQLYTSNQEAVSKDDGSRNCKGPRVADGRDCDEQSILEADVIQNLHLFLKRFPETGQKPEAFAEQLLQSKPERIVVTTELGCGVVPMEPADREWRERSGRVGCALAAVSAEVYRVQCGLAQRLK